MNDAEKTATLTKRWFAYAQRDLEAAKALLEQEDRFNQQICFFAQQAAEKAIKAGLVFLQVKFPFVHDLDELRDLLPQDWSCRMQYSDLELLSDWAVRSRYPIDPTEPAKEEAQEALQQAKGVLEAIEQDLAKQGLSLPNKD